MTGPETVAATGVSVGDDCERRYWAGRYRSKGFCGLDWLCAEFRIGMFFVYNVLGFHQILKRLGSF